MILASILFLLMCVEVYIIPEASFFFFFFFLRSPPSLPPSLKESLLCLSLWHADTDTDTRDKQTGKRYIYLSVISVFNNIPMQQKS